MPTSVSAVSLFLEMHQFFRSGYLYFIEGSLAFLKVGMSTFFNRRMPNCTMQQSDLFEPKIRPNSPKK